MPKLEKDVTGWNEEAYGIPKAIEYVRQDDFTIALVVNEDDRLFVGVTKQHPVDSADERTARLLALQRAQPLKKANTVVTQLWCGGALEEFRNRNKGE